MCAIKTPSHLVKNRYGVFYYCIVFPRDIRIKLNKQQARRSLRTKDRVIALMMAREYKKITKWIFYQVRYNDLKWIEIKRILDKTADQLFQKYIFKVNEVGFDFKDEHALSEILPCARPFLFNNAEQQYIDAEPSIETSDGDDTDYEVSFIYRADFESKLPDFYRAMCFFVWITHISTFAIFNEH